MILKIGSILTPDSMNGKTDRSMKVKIVGIGSFYNIDMRSQFVDNSVYKP